MNDENGLCPSCSRKVTYRSWGLILRVAETGVIENAEKYPMMYADENPRGYGIVKAAVEL